MTHDEMFTCWDCDNCMSRIDGFYCYECGEQPVKVADRNEEPTQDFMKCGGTKWE